MARLDILKSPEYWITRIQLALYNCAYKYMETNKKNRTQLAEHLGVTKGYVTQLLNGDYDHKLSKLVELSLKCGYVPKIDFVPIEEYCNEDGFSQDFKNWDNNSYSRSNYILKDETVLEVGYTYQDLNSFKNVA